MKIKLTAPGLRNLTLVDLPGMHPILHHHGFRHADELVLGVIHSGRNSSDVETSKELTKRFSHPAKKNLVVLVLDSHNNIEISAAASILLDGIKAAKGVVGPAKSIAIMTKLDSQDGYVDVAKACIAINGEHGVPNMPPIYVS
jgi:hypothetical protein